jgi:hypothetical protein
MSMMHILNFQTPYHSAIPLTNKEASTIHSHSHHPQLPHPHWYSSHQTSDEYGTYSPPTASRSPVISLTPSSGEYDTSPILDSLSPLISLSPVLFLSPVWWWVCYKVTTSHHLHSSSPLIFLSRIVLIQKKKFFIVMTKCFLLIITMYINLTIVLQ